jgi:hypothetical protein
MKRRATYIGKTFKSGKLKLVKGTTGIAKLDFIVEGDGIGIYHFTDYTGKRWYIEEKDLHFPEPNVEVA